MARSVPPGHGPGGRDGSGAEGRGRAGFDESVDLSVIFTAWNEEATLERAVAAARQAGTLLRGAADISSFEIVVVDDGSTDRTAEIAEKLAVEDPRVRLVSHPHNRGLGAAMRTGYATCRGRLVVCTGADLPFDLLELGKAIRILHNHEADIVAAYRFDRTGEGPRRFVYSYAYNLLVRTAFGLRVRDVNFAAKLIRREVLDTVELRSEGSFIDAELLARATRRGFRIVQFGVDYFPRSRGVSTLSSLPVIRTILREMVASSRDLRRAQSSTT